jgi:hypothetical protein
MREGTRRLAAPLIILGIVALVFAGLIFWMAVT